MPAEGNHVSLIYLAFALDLLVVIRLFPVTRTGLSTVKALGARLMMSIPCLGVIRVIAGLTKAAHLVM